MSKRAKADSRGRSSKAASGRKPKPKGKSKRKRPSNRGTTKKAREGAAGFIPSPNFAIIASDPLKAQIVAVALQRLYSPSEFARDVGVALNVASYAFQVLKGHGILELVEEVKVRGSVKHMYRATEAALVSNADWGSLAEAMRRAFTGTILQDFSARVTQAIETGDLYSRDDFCLYWAPRDLDEIAWKEMVEIYKWCIEASEQLEADTVNRRAEGEGGDDHSFHATFAIAAFPSPTHSELKKHQKKKAQEQAAPAKAKGKPKAERDGPSKSTGRGKGKEA